MCKNMTYVHWFCPKAGTAYEEKKRHVGQVGYNPVTNSKRPTVRIQGTNLTIKIKVGKNHVDTSKNLKIPRRLKLINMATGN
jgi:hypothetical protein